MDINETTVLLLAVATKDCLDLKGLFEVEKPGGSTAAKLWVTFPIPKCFHEATERGALRGLWLRDNIFGVLELLGGRKTGHVIESWSE